MTTQTRTRAAVLALPLTSVLLLAACGGDDAAAPLGDGPITAGAVDSDPDTAPEPAPPADDATTTSPDPADAADTSTESGGGSAAAGGSGDAAAGLPPRPAMDSCVRIPVPDDGVYTVYEAGTAVVTFADGRLTLESVEAAEGWTARVDDEDADEVEIDFRRDGEVLDLEVEVDDGRVEAEICSDDD